MYSDWGLLAIFGAVFVWLSILSFFLWQGKGFLKELFPKSGERDIRKKFEEVLEELSKAGTRLNQFSGKLEQLEKEGLGYIQKVQLLRYNPYEDTGGDQSFSVALLNKKGDGLVVTSLHTRSGTRVFAKPVKAGKAENYPFSKEEEKVVKEAL